ncbi:12486_t:CDS:2, partial [Dentiscutata heterogama]
KILDRFEELNKHSADSLIGSRISNYSASAKIFGYAFALFYDHIHLVQILSIFSKTNSTFHSYIDVSVKAINSLFYIFVK